MVWTLLPMAHTHQPPHQGCPDLPTDKEPRAVQLLLGHTKLEGTVPDLCIQVEDALEMSEQTEI